jgi:dTDP-4-dehydrorhamnose reductase
MLGHTLLGHLAANPRLKVHASVRDMEMITRHFPSLPPETVHVTDVDVTDPAPLENLFARIRPDIVINCIGIIKQSPLAKESTPSMNINALLPHRLESLCGAAGSRLIHFSTDCVFDGARGNYVENDAPNATDLYGKSKSLGEVSGRNSVTLRTSIIGHELGTRNGLVEWFLSREGKVNGFTNAVFSGFPTIEIARIVSGFIIPSKELHGIYHLSSAPISKFDLLGLIAAKYGNPICIEPYPDFHVDRSLNSRRFAEATGYLSPSWDELIDGMHADYMSASHYEQKRRLSGATLQG